MITRNKKKKLENQRSDKIDEIPLDLVIESLRRLPVKSVARFLLISKSWERIIRSPHFIKSYPFGSCSSQPRVLVAFMDRDRQKGRQDLYSFSQSLSSTSFLSCVNCPLPYLEWEYDFMYVNGLISVGCGKERFLINPSTGRSIALPNVETRETFHEQLMRSFFGYDSVNDQYKVLCIVNLFARRHLSPSTHHWQSLPSTQHQVLTLGAKNSWRMIKCSIPHSHRPVSYAQVCIDGVVYYFANTGAGLSQLSLMRFDLKSEKLDLFTSLSADIQARQLYHPMTLINYKGKVAMPIKASEYTFEVWVIDQYANNHGWLKVISFSLKPWKSLYIRGTTHGLGEIILSQSYPRCDDFNVILYNPDTNSLRNTKVEVNKDYEFKCRRSKRAIVFPDYIESVRLL